MKIMKWALLVAALALAGCTAAVAPPEQEPASIAGTRAAAVVEPSITATKQDEARDHVTVYRAVGRGLVHQRRVLRLAAGPQDAAESADGHQAQPDRPLRRGQVKFQRGRGFVVVTLNANHENLKRSAHVRRTALT